MRDTRPAKRCIGAVEEWVDKLQVYPRTKPEYIDQAAFSLISKVRAVSTAVCALVDKKFDDEAFSCSRTALEIAIGLRHLSNKDTERRVRRYVEYYGKHREEWVTLTNKYYPTQEKTYSNDHSHLLKMAQKYSSPHKWSESDLRRMAAEPSTVDFKEDGSPDTWEFQYEFMYKWTSYYVHGTVVALDVHVPHSGRPWVLGPAAQPTSVGKLAIFNVISSLYASVLFATRMCNIDIDKKLWPLFKRSFDSTYQNWDK
jgi:hypothetical protein